MDNNASDCKIGITIHYPFQYHVHKNVYKALKKRGADVKFIIDPTVTFPTAPEEETLKRTHALLVAEGVDFVEFSYDHSFSELLTNSFLSSYRAFISTWHKGLIGKADTQYKIFITYGAGKELTTFGFGKRFFDLCLSYGQYDHQFFSQLTKSVIIGNPKFDDWFSKNFDEKLIESLSKRIDSAKKTILYLPTHSDLCSMDELADTLRAATRNYNVIVKLHYYNVTEDAETVKRFDNSDVVVLDDSVDLLTLISISDVILSDNSSAIFDALLADKPVVVTDFHTKEYLDQGHRTVRSYRRGWASALTYSNSIEQRVKRDGTVVSVQNTHEFYEAVAQALADDPEIQEKRRKLTKTLFEYQDASAGDRGADAIMSLLQSPKSNDRPFLAHAIDLFEEETLRKYRASTIVENAPLHNEAEMNAQKREMESVCFILYSNGRTGEEVYKTFLSLLFFKNIRSVVILSDDPGHLTDTLDKFRQEKEIHFFRTNQLIQVVEERASKHSRLIFISAGCVFDYPPFQYELVENLLFHEKTALSTGYVMKRVRNESTQDRLLDLEIRVAAGYTHYDQTLAPIYFYRVENVFLESPVDEPRFFSIDTKLITDGEILIRHVRDTYQLLLTLKHHLVSMNKPSAFLPIIIVDESDRTGFYKYKRTTRIAVEFGSKYPFTRMVKRKMKLVEATISFPYANIVLFPYAIADLLMTSLMYLHFKLGRLRGVYK